MNFVCIVGSSRPTGYANQPHCNWIELAFICTRSLGRHCDCVLVCDWNGLNSIVRETVTIGFPGPVLFRRISDEVWCNRMAMNKIPRLDGLPVRDGDQVVMLDLDTIVKADIFKVFEQDFDLAYTSRPYPNPTYPVNAGVWAFRVNARTRQFFRWFHTQAEKPTWKKLIGLQLLRGSFGRKDMFPDQDVLCACAMHGFPFGLKTIDIGSQWNWYPQDWVHNPIRQYASSGAKILHFKSQFKPHMLEPCMDWPPRIELEITLRCNISCPTCNRHCNIYNDGAGTDMSMEQIHRFIADVKRSGRKLEYVAVLGGEPLLHPHYAKIMTALHEGLILPGYMPELRTVTNGVLPVPDDVLALAPTIITSEHETKIHYETLLAPKDADQARVPCSVLRNCGISLSCYGYAPCGPGAAIARLFGLSQYMSDDLPANAGDFGDLEPICELCQRGVAKPFMLPRGGKARASVTYAEAIEKYEPSMIPKRWCDA